MGRSPKGSQREGPVTWIGYIDFRLSLLPRFQGKPDDASSPEKGTSLHSFVAPSTSLLFTTRLQHHSPQKFRTFSLSNTQHAAHKYSSCGSETGLSTRSISQATVSVGDKTLLLSLVAPSHSMIFFPRMLTFSISRVPRLDNPHIPTNRRRETGSSRLRNLPTHPLRLERGSQGQRRNR